MLRDSRVTLVLTQERLLDAGISALSGLTALDASVGDAYNAAGYEVIASTPEELGAFLREEQVYWAKLARELGMVQ